MTAGIGASVLLADLVYDVPANVILDSARRALSGYDVVTSCIKAWVFGLIISTVRHLGLSLRTRSIESLLGHRGSLTVLVSLPALGQYLADLPCIVSNPTESICYQCMHFMMLSDR